MMESPSAFTQDATRDVEAGQIHDALHMLDATIDQLDKVAGRLEQRAQPILTPQPPAVEASSPNAVAEVRDSPIAERIRMIETRVRMHVHRIEYTTDRMQV